MNAFITGFLQGAAGAKERRNEREARARDIAAAARSMRRDDGTASAPPSSGDPAFTYDGKIGDRAAHTFTRMRAAGVPDVVTAGIVGNLMQESGTEINPAAVGDNGNAFGAVQWNGDRMRAYKAFAERRGVDPTDYDTQVDFLLHEGKTTEKAAWDAIMQAQTPEEAARIASERFWRPGVPALDRRMAYAAAAYKNRPADPQAAPSRVVAIQRPTDWAWFRTFKGNPV